jgi:hypothetical protein
MITRKFAATTYLRAEAVESSGRLKLYAALRCLIAVATHPSFRTAEFAQ